MNIFTIINIILITWLIVFAKQTIQDLLLILHWYERSHLSTKESNKWWDFSWRNGKSLHECIASWWKEFINNRGFNKRRFLLEVGYKFWEFQNIRKSVITNQKLFGLVGTTFCSGELSEDTSFEMYCIEKFGASGSREFGNIWYWGIWIIRWRRIWLNVLLRHLLTWTSSNFECCLTTNQIFIWFGSSSESLT